MIDITQPHKRTVIKKFRWATDTYKWEHGDNCGCNPERYHKDYRNCYKLNRKGSYEEVLEKAKEVLDGWQNNRNRLARVEYALECGYGILRLVRYEQLTEKQLLQEMKYRRY